MRKTAEMMIEELNNLLKLNGQRTRIVYWSGNYVLLNCGVELENKKEKQRFVKRTKGKFKNNVDDIYAYDRFPQHIQKKICKSGGKKTQELHGDTLKKNLNYKNGTPWNKGKKVNIEIWNRGKNKYNDYRLMKLSKSRKSTGNPMYDHKHSEEYKRNKSIYMKSLIENGDFTPNIHNSRTHMQTEVNGKKFRSSWEAAFYTINPDYLYEDLRVPYNFNNSKKIYIPDFISYKNKEVVEIKPSTIKRDEKFIAKENALLDWCENNKFEYKLINEDYFIEKWDYINFDIIDDESINNLIKMRHQYENKKYKKNT